MEELPDRDARKHCQFKKNWRNCFDTYEEDSDIFKSIVKGKAEEGSEMYLPLFSNGKSSVIDYIDKFDTVLLDKNTLMELKNYELLINERYEEYRYDITRPLLKPSELFVTESEVKRFLKDRKITKFAFKNFESKKVIKPKKKSVQAKGDYKHQIPEINDLISGTSSITKISFVIIFWYLYIYLRSIFNCIE